VRFAKEILNLTNITDDQAEVLQLLAGDATNISVKSGHGVGKTAISAVAALWYLFTRDNVTVVTTAPTERQVKELLWREIRKWHKLANGKLEGKPLTMKLELSPNRFAIGISTNETQQIQGFHNDNILIIVDEANGYNEDLFDALDSLLSGGEAKLLMIGNPIEPSGKFFRSFSDGETATKTISCYTHPNIVYNKPIVKGAVTKQWVDKRIQIYGEDSAFVQSRIKGIFPKIAHDIVINLGWIEHAEQIGKLKEPKVQKKPPKGHELYLGHDPGEFGNDEYVWLLGTKDYVYKVISKNNIEPAESIDFTEYLIKQYKLNPKHVTIDGIGVGATIYSKVNQKYKGINRFVASESAINHKRFEDCSTEAWWHARDMLNPASEIYNEFYFIERPDLLKADLCTRKYRTSHNSRIMLEPKREYRKRMKRSPNYADAFINAYYPLISNKNAVFTILPDVIGNGY
jgi:phage terminase large subunit